MLRQSLRAAVFRRDAYLRAVLSSHGVADAVVIVAAVYTALALTVSHRAVTDVLAHLRFVVDGAIAWLIISGAVYLVSRHLLRGEGTFQGMVATTALAHPVLLLLILVRAGTPVPLTYLGHPTLLILDRARSLDFLPLVALLAATVWFLAVLVAGTRVAMGLSLDRAAVAVGAGYGAWWAIATLLRF